MVNWRLVANSSVAAIPKPRTTLAAVMAGSGMAAPASTPRFRPESASRPVTQLRKYR
jgi:hypothetical protein